MHAPPLANNLDPCLCGCHCGSLSGHHAVVAFHAAKQTKPASPSQDGHQPTLTARRLVARCTELRSYIETNEGALIDYGERYRAGKPISTSRAEGTVNQLVSARMNKRWQMRWSP